MFRLEQFYIYKVLPFHIVYVNRNDLWRQIYCSAFYINRIPFHDEIRRKAVVCLSIYWLRYYHWNKLIISTMLKWLIFQIYSNNHSKKIFSELNLNFVVLKGLIWKWLSKRTLSECCKEQCYCRIKKETNNLQIIYWFQLLWQAMNYNKEVKWIGFEIIIYFQVVLLLNCNKIMT